MKKVLSLVLVIAMVLSSMSFAFASPLTDISDSDYKDAINTLVGLGIIDGYEDGTFRPEKTVTRAQMAKMLVVTLGYGDLVSGSKSNFADTQGHWADAYVALAAGKGLVQGYPNGTFRPDKTVSYDEALTIVVRALGYTDSCNELKGMTWPTNFKVKAAELKITKDVVLTATGADRGGIAQLINNALKVALVKVNTDGDVIKATTTTTNSQNEVVTKYVLLLSRLATSKTIDKVTPDYLDEDSKLYAGDIVDLAPYMYQNIEVYENDDDEVVYVNDVESDVKIGEFRHAKDDPNKVNVRIDGKNKLYSLEDPAETKVFYNGVEVTMTENEMEIGSATKVNLHKAAATFVLNDDNEIVGIIADKYTDAVKVSNEYNGKTKLEGYMLPLDDDDEVDYTKLTVKGAVTTLEDIKEDDVIVLFAGAGLVNAKTTEAEKLTIEVVSRRKNH
jgi:S-layer family protein